MKQLTEQNKCSNEVSNDKIDCFARISKVKCNALKSKKCLNCNFYKKKEDVPNYKMYIH